MHAKLVEFCTAWQEDQSIAVCPVQVYFKLKGYVLKQWYVLAIEAMEIARMLLVPVVIRHGE